MQRKSGGHLVFSFKPCLILPILHPLQGIIYKKDYIGFLLIAYQIWLISFQLKRVKRGMFVEHSRTSVLYI